MLPALPFGRIALYSFALNTLWEFGQCIFLYDMWGRGFWRSAAWMWSAIFGDVVIVLGVVLSAAWISRCAGRLAPPTVAGWSALLSVGFVAGIRLEWLAQALDLWDYSDLMPTLSMSGCKVGLSPSYR